MLKLLNTVIMKKIKGSIEIERINRRIIEDISISMQQYIFNRRQNRFGDAEISEESEDEVI